MFTINGIWYIPIALLVFGVLIFIHEFGHFFCARLFGVPIKEFAIGMGPKLFSFQGKKYDTVYSLRLLPIGGYVSMVGEDEESDDSNALGNKPVWQRIIITAAGATLNLLLGVIVMTALVIGQDNFASTTIHSFSENALSCNYGLEAGDTVIKVNNTKIHVVDELLYEIMMQGTNPVDLTVVRDGEKIVLKDVSFPQTVTEGIAIGEADFFVYAEAKTFVNVMKHSLYRSWSTVKMIWDSLIGLFTGRFGMEAVSGPVGVTSAIGEAASNGFSHLVYLAVVISMNLGIFNLLPIPALDGGRIFFMLIELIFRKPIDPKYEGYIHFAGIIVLFALMAFVTFKDILKLFI